MVVFWLFRTFGIHIFVWFSLFFLSVITPGCVGEEMLWTMGVENRYPLRGLQRVARGGPEGSGVRPAVSFAFDVRFRALKKRESGAQRRKKWASTSPPVSPGC